MKKIAVALLAVSLSTTAAAALKNTSGTVTDGYYGAKLSGGSWASNSTDALGGTSFDLQSLRYSYNETNNALTITVNQGAFRDGYVSNGSTYKNGDLFLHFNLNNVADVSDSRKDISDGPGTVPAGSGLAKGVDWNDGFGFVFDTQTSKIYGGNFGIEYAGSARAAGVPLSNGNDTWTGVSGRNGQEVGYGKAGSGTLISSAANDSTLKFVDAHDGTLTYTFNLQKLASTTNINIADINSYMRTGALDLSARWAMNCGNDVLQARFKVPEPSILALLGLGLIGVAGLRRRA